MKRLFFNNLRIHVLLLVLLAALTVYCPSAIAVTVQQQWVRFSAVAGETLTTGDIVSIKDADGYAYKADANDAALRPAVGIVGQGAASGSKAEIIVIGLFSGYTSLSEGQPAYLSETAGTITQSAPSYVQQIGTAISATKYLFSFKNYFDSSAVTSLGVLSGATPIIMEGASADAFETTITPTDPTADRTVTLQDASGTVELVQAKVSETVTAANVLTASECGKTMYLNSATEFQTTLPAVSTITAGCEFTFIIVGAPSGANYTIITGNSLENVITGGATERETDTNDDGPYLASADTIAFVDGLAVAGDYIKLISDGSTYYMHGQVNADGALTITQAD